MGGAEAGPAIAVEVLIEQHEIAPVRILLELPGGSIEGPATVGITQEDPRESA